LEKGKRAAEKALGLSHSREWQKTLTIKQVIIKNRKAAGPGEIYDQYLQAVQPLLLEI
jgi:hypothetical protein